MEEIGIMKLLGFRETSRFTSRVVELLDDEDYAKLQLYLAEFPDAGSLIKGGGGIRKLRYALPGRGKSGGARIIYFWAVENGLILMLEIYAKNEQGDLSDDQVNALRKEVKGINP
ncbi:MAG: type II toxin-antitoxin system RelE/ParE family toxin [Blastocatellia bacterium]